MATPSPYLDDEQIQRLSDLLDQRAVPFRGMNLEALDGFLSALVVAPSPVPQEAWEPVVWGGKAPSWGSAEEAAEVRNLLLGHWNMCAARARNGEEDLPDHLMPLMWLPEDPEKGEDALGEDELDVGREWALGFFEGVGLREAEWDRWLDENDWIDEIFALLERLATGEGVDIGAANADAMDANQRLTGTGHGRPLCGREREAARLFQKDSLHEVRPKPGSCWRTGWYRRCG